MSLNITPWAKSDNGYAAMVYTLGCTCKNHTCTSMGDCAKAESMFHDSIKGCTSHCTKQVSVVVPFVVWCVLGIN